MKENYQIKSYGITDTGLKRQHNEDFILLNKNKNLFILADGLGGHNAGEIASSEACMFFNKAFDPGDEQIKNTYNALFKEVNRKIYSLGMENLAYTGMGTTLICCYIKGGIAHFGHIGDVRGYIFRKGYFIQLTEDQSAVAELVKKELITEEEAKNHPLKNIVSQAIGSEDSVSPGYVKEAVKKGDIIMLCSDGLWGMLEDSIIRTELQKKAPLKKKAENLLKMANEAGGIDNISHILVQIT